MSLYCSLLDGQQDGVQVRHVDAWFEGDLLVANVTYVYAPASGTNTSRFAGELSLGIQQFEATGKAGRRSFTPVLGHGYFVAFSSDWFHVEIPERLVDEHARRDLGRASFGYLRTGIWTPTPGEEFTLEYGFPMANLYEGKQGFYGFGFEYRGSGAPGETRPVVLMPCFNRDTPPWFGEHPDGGLWCMYYNADGMSGEDAIKKRCPPHPRLEEAADYTFTFHSVPPQ